MNHMKMCEEHWQQLQQAIKDRGLWGFVSKSGDLAARRAKNQMEGKGNPRDYDPLLVANIMISSKVIEVEGPEIMAKGGDVCPLCEVDKHAGKEEETRWVNDCTDAVLKHCIKLGLVPPVS